MALRRTCVVSSGLRSMPSRPSGVNEISSSAYSPRSSALSSSPVRSSKEEGVERRVRVLALSELDQEEQEVVSGQPGGRDDANDAQGEGGADLFHAAAVLSAETTQGTCEGHGGLGRCPGVPDVNVPAALAQFQVFEARAGQRRQGEAEDARVHVGGRASRPGPSDTRAGWRPHPRRCCAWRTRSQAGTADQRVSVPWDRPESAAAMAVATAFAPSQGPSNWPRVSTAASRLHLLKDQILSKIEATEAVAL